MQPTLSSLCRAAAQFNEVTSADGGWRVLYAVVAQWPAAAEFLRYAAKPMVGLPPGAGDGSEDRMMNG